MNFFCKNKKKVNMTYIMALRYADEHVHLRMECVTCDLISNIYISIVIAYMKQSSILSFISW